MPARKVRFLASPVAKKSPLTVHESLGVAALIDTWDFPIGMPTRKVRILTFPLGGKSLLTVHEPLEWLPSSLLGTSPVGDKSQLTVHKPLGVAALTAPCNFPIGMPAKKVRFLASPVGEKNLLSLLGKTLLKSACDTEKHHQKSRH
jgi:hypothetical protein